MHPTGTPSLGFEWNGQFHCMTVLPFGLASAPWLFSKVMGHCLRLLRLRRLSLPILGYLVDSVFAAKTARESLSTAQTLVHVLHR